MFRTFLHYRRSPLTHGCAFAAGLAALCSLPVVLLAADPSAPAETNADDRLIDTVRRRVAEVTRLANAATNSVDLTARLSVQMTPTGTPTNVTETVIAPPPAPEPVFVLRGLSLTGRPLALLNGHWFGVGDRVSADGILLAKVGTDRVVLVNTQGVQRVISLYRERK